MAIAGIDAGLKNLKILILEEDKIIFDLVHRIGKDSIATATERAMEKATEATGITSDKLEYVVATGTSRYQVPLAKEQSPESICLAKGIEFLKPSFAGIVLDIGAHKALAVRCENGMPSNIARSDRCAAGAGEYLEMVADLLAITPADMGELYKKSQNPVEIQSTCTVFAESEIISLLHQKKGTENILKGALMGFASRVYPLLLTAGFPSDIVLVGGVARNKGVIQAIEDQIHQSIVVLDNPNTVGALGAALIASEQMRSSD
jgi:predicted CoA-substrate-specific enzyme activase